MPEFHNYSRYCMFEQSYIGGKNYYELEVGSTAINHSNSSYICALRWTDLADQVIHIFIMPAYRCKNRYSYNSVDPPSGTSGQLQQLCKAFSESTLIFFFTVEFTIVCFVMYSYKANKRLLVARLKNLQRLFWRFEGLVYHT